VEGGSLPVRPETGITFGTLAEIRYATTSPHGKSDPVEVTMPLPLRMLYMFHWFIMSTTTRGRSDCAKISVRLSLALLISLPSLLLF